MKSIELWHKRARPEPDEKAFNVQLGCHLEEIVEMLSSIESTYKNMGEFLLARVKYDLNSLATYLKNGEVTIELRDRKEFLDSLADQVVTAIGAGYCAGMKMVEAIEEVNNSNWSKFDQETGLPIFNEHGKIMKGAAYKAPDLKGMF
jgi:hypothetical protein